MTASIAFAGAGVLTTATIAGAARLLRYRNERRRRALAARLRPHR